MKTAVREQVNAMDAESHYSLLASLMKDNPPAKEDEPMLAKMAKIGLVPGKEWEFKKIDPNVAKMFDSNMRRARMQILGQSRYAGKPVNNWEMTTKTGKYGTDYDQRAYVTWIGLGANLPRDAVYPVAAVDYGRQATERRKQIRDPLRQQERFAAGQRLLVADDVQHRDVFRRQSAESIHPERARQFEDK